MFSLPRSKNRLHHIHTLTLSIPYLYPRTNSPFYSPYQPLHTSTHPPQFPSQVGCMLSLLTPPCTDCKHATMRAKVRRMSSTPSTVRGMQVSHTPSGPPNTPSDHPNTPSGPPNTPFDPPHTPSGPPYIPSILSTHPLILSTHSLVQHCSAPQAHRRRLGAHQSRLRRGAVPLATR